MIKAQEELKRAKEMPINKPAAPKEDKPEVPRANSDLKTLGVEKP